MHILWRLGIKKLKSIKLYRALVFTSSTLSTFNFRFALLLLCFFLFLLLLLLGLFRSFRSVLFVDLRLVIYTFFFSLKKNWECNPRAALFRSCNSLAVADIYRCILLLLGVAARPSLLCLVTNVRVIETEWESAKRATNRITSFAVLSQHNFCSYRLIFVFVNLFLFCPFSFCLFMCTHL